MLFPNISQQICLTPKRLCLSLLKFISKCLNVTIALFFPSFPSQIFGSVSTQFQISPLLWKKKILKSGLPIIHFIRSNINFKEVFWEVLWDIFSGIQSPHRSTIRNNSVYLTASVILWWTLHHIYIVLKGFDGM